MSNVWGQILQGYERTARPDTSIKVKDTTKVCTKCGEKKDRSEFYARPTRGVDVVTGSCKACLIKASTERNIKKREKK